MLCIVGSESNLSLYLMHSSTTLIFHEYIEELGLLTIFKALKIMYT